MIDCRLLQNFANKCGLVSLVDPIVKQQHLDMHRGHKGLLQWGMLHQVTLRSVISKVAEVMSPDDISIHGAS